MLKRGLVAIIFVMLIAPLAIASFQLGNNSNIADVYSSRAGITGFLNISFANENAESMILSNFQGGIKLKEFLNTNQKNYNCNTKNCIFDYELSSPEESKTFSLNSGQEKLFAFTLNGIIDAIEGFSFNINADNEPSCINPIEIDILDDNSSEFVSKKVGNDYSCTYGNSMGCFNANEALISFQIRTTPYCEKINLTQSSKFLLGAWVKKETTAWQDGMLKMYLYNLDGEMLKSCNLPMPSNTGSEISCNISFFNNMIKEYYVCIKSTASTDYTIKGEGVNSCGFYGEPPKIEEHDYYIFARGAKFENFGNIFINQSKYENYENSGELVSYLEDYLPAEKNCSFSCKLPLKIKANSNLTINIFNLSLKYSTSIGAGPAENKIYIAFKKPPKLTSQFNMLDLSKANITLPSGFGNHTLILYINNTEILRKNITIENVPIINFLFPVKASAAVSTLFRTNVSSIRNITSYKWDFGDNTTEITSIPFVLHTYLNITNYTLTLEATDSAGFKSSKLFTIMVVSPKENINLTFIDYKARISNITPNLNSYPAWTKLKERIDIDSIKEQLTSLERRYNAASNENEYAIIMRNLSGISIPSAIKEEKGEIPFFADYRQADIARLKEIGAGNYESEEATRKAIGRWINSKLEMKIEFTLVRAYYLDKIENLAGIFNLKITSKEDKDKNLYFIIDKIGVKFEEQLASHENNGKTEVIFDDTKSRNINFAIHNSEIDSFKIILSPKFSELPEEPGTGVCNSNNQCENNLGENWRNCKNDCKPTTLVIILVGAVIILGILAYLFLQWWYSVKYETHLFKKRADIFNLINFITNAKNQGISESEIKTNLKKSGWTSEQISYMYKKMSGKAMIPFSFFRFFRKKEERYSTI